MKGRVAVLEVFLLPKLLSQRPPDSHRCVGLAAGESDDLDRTQGGVGLVEAPNDLFSELGVFSEEAKSQKVVRLTATHCLLEFEQTLVRLTLQSTETVLQQGLHALGDVDLREELVGVDPIVNEIRQVQDGIPLLGIKDALTRLAQFV